ncbi:MAG: acyl-CoA dehydrogenase [Acidimicrobiia bacterium]|nr:acyl-CoA dehydrogenase [Acidimicrobiia bacterium]
MTSTIHTAADATGELLPDELVEQCRRRAAGYDHDNRFFTEDFDELCAAGYLLAALPRSHGGAGAGLGTVVAAQRRLANAAPPTALALSMHLYFTGAAAQLHAMGNPSVGWILDEAAAGEVFAAGHAETGNDLPVLLSTTRAERVPGGYRITGRKRFGSLGPVWTRLGIHALDPSDAEHPRIVHAFVDRHADGVHVQDQWDTLGMRATQSYDTLLEAVFVPDHRVARALPAGDPTDPWFGTMSTWAFLQFAGVYLGIADRALELAIGLARTKTSIAVPRGTMSYNPEVQHVIAAMYIDVLTAATLLGSTTADWDAAVSHPDWPARALAAKHVAVDRATEVVARALEVAGGGALATGHELERLYRDVRAGWFNGVNGHLAIELIGKGVLGVEPQPRW